MSNIELRRKIKKEIDRLPPRRLEDDRVYRRYPKDWQVYHTRWIDTDGFRSALLPRERALSFER